MTQLPPVFHASLQSVGRLPRLGGDQKCSPSVIGDTEIRVVNVDGEPWFVAADVAKALGYRDGPRITRFVADDQRDTHKVGTSGAEWCGRLAHRAASRSLDQRLRSRHPTTRRTGPLLIDQRRIPGLSSGLQRPLGIARHREIEKALTVARWQSVQWQV